MNAFILVFAHRYFATTDAEGRYRIEGVPPGAYTLAVWNDGQVRARREVRVAAPGDVVGAGLHGGVMARPLGSLRSRVFAATALVAVLPTVLALGLATRRVTQEAEAELARSLAEAARLVEQYHGARLETARERASLVADLPKLKAAVAEGDPRTAEPDRPGLSRPGALGRAGADGPRGADARLARGGRRGLDGRRAALPRGARAAPRDGRRPDRPRHRGPGPPRARLRPRRRVRGAPARADRQPRGRGDGGARLRLDAAAPRRRRPAGGRGGHGGDEGRPGRRGARGRGHGAGRGRGRAPRPRAALARGGAAPALGAAGRARRRRRSSRWAWGSS